MFLKAAEQQHVGKCNIVKFPKIFPASWKTKGEDLPPPASINKDQLGENPKQRCYVDFDFHLY